MSHGTYQLITGEYIDGGSRLCIVVKTTICVSIYINFLHCAIICVHIGVLRNCMKCCDYLVPIQHNVFFLNKVNRRSCRLLTLLYAHMSMLQR